MRKLNLLVGLMVIIAFTLAACSTSQPVDNVMSGESENSSNEMAETMSEGMPENAESSDEMMEGEGDEMAGNAHDAGEEMTGEAQDSMEENQMSETPDAPEEMTADSSPVFAWVGHEFNDAATGGSFSVDSFRGKVVLVETMAMWCSNCLKQQNQVKELHSLLGEREDFVSIGIGVDPNEDNGRLATYVQNNGFDWFYSVAPTDVLADIQQTLGGQFLNPPSTPIVLFDKDGQPHPLPFGIKSANELLGYVESYLN